MNPARKKKRPTVVVDDSGSELDDDAGAPANKRGRASVDGSDDSTSAGAPRPGAVQTTLTWGNSTRSTVDGESASEPSAAAGGGGGGAGAGAGASGWDAVGFRSAHDAAVGLGLRDGDDASPAAPAAASGPSSSSLPIASFLEDAAEDEDGGGSESDDGAAAGARGGDDDVYEMDGFVVPDSQVSSVSGMSDAGRMRDVMAMSGDGDGIDAFDLGAAGVVGGTAAAAGAGQAGEDAVTHLSVMRRDHGVQAAEMDATTLLETIDKMYADLRDLPVAGNEVVDAVKVLGLKEDSRVPDTDESFTTGFTTEQVDVHFRKFRDVLFRLKLRGEDMQLLSVAGSAEQVASFNRLLFIYMRYEHSAEILRRVCRIREMGRVGVSFFDKVSMDRDILMPLVHDGDKPVQNILVEVLREVMRRDLRRRHDTLYVEHKTGDTPTCCYVPYKEVSEFVWDQLSPDEYPARFPHMGFASAALKTMIGNISTCMLPELVTDNTKISFRNGILDLMTLEFHPMEHREQVLQTRSARRFYDCDLDPDLLSSHPMDMAVHTPALQQILNTQRMFGDVDRVRARWKRLKTNLSEHIFAERTRLSGDGGGGGGGGAGAGAGGGGGARWPPKASGRRRGDIEYLWDEMQRVLDCIDDTQTRLGVTCVRYSTRTGDPQDNEVDYWNLRDELEELEAEYSRRTVQLRCVMTGRVLHMLVRDLPLLGRGEDAEQLKAEGALDSDWASEFYDPLLSPMAPEGPVCAAVRGEGVDGVELQEIKAADLECAYCREHLATSAAAVDDNNGVDYERLHMMCADMPRDVLPGYGVSVVLDTDARHVEDGYDGERNEKLTHVLLEDVMLPMDGVEAQIQAEGRRAQDAALAEGLDMETVMFRKKHARFLCRKRLYGPALMAKWWFEREDAAVRAALAEEGDAAFGLGATDVAARMSEAEAGWEMDDPDSDSDDPDADPRVLAWRRDMPAPRFVVRHDALPETRPILPEEQREGELLRPGMAVSVRYQDVEGDEPVQCVAKATVRRVTADGTPAWRRGREPWRLHVDRICPQREAPGRQAMAMMGYNNKPVKQHWAPQASLLLIGESGVGKSLLCQMMMRWFQSHQVGTLESKPHAQWWLTNLYDKEVVFTTELRRDSTLDVSMLQKMIGGENVVVQRRNRDEIQMDWRAPIVVCGNELGLRDSKDALRRRFVTVRFKYRPATRDPGLERALDKENWATLIRCILEYHTLAGHSMMRTRPHVASRLRRGARESDRYFRGRTVALTRARCQEFREAELHLASHLDSFRAFMRNEMRLLRFGPNLRMSRMDLQTKYGQYCRAMNTAPRIVPKNDLVLRAYRLKTVDMRNKDDELEHFVVGVGPSSTREST